MRLQIFLFAFLFSLSLSSCYYNKRLVYLQDNEFSETTPSLVANKRSPYRLQPYDILSVQIKSSAEREISGIFNVSSMQNSMFATPGGLYIEGYSVDLNGNIDLPVLGEITVRGNTLEETQELIQLHANKYLNNSAVIVKLTSFKIPVLGEVNSPGQYFIYNNQATVW